MVALKAVFLKDLALAYRQRAELMQPLMFFVLVITLFPLAVGPNLETLQRIGGGVIWVAAILSLLLGMERMFRDDFADGSLEQYILSPTPLYMIVVVKVFTHWLMHIVPLFLISPLLAVFLNLTMDMYVALMLTLLLGTPLISFVGAIGVALTVGLHRGGVLLALLLIPIFIPLLIFATSAIESASMLLPYHPQLAIIAALLLFSVALSPMAIAYSLKVSQN
ncbi:heme exporter protein CcmB [Brumicola nitratireducens]|jgi:heme exporter protein B|uniref:Heme exporter protein B n=1 Tax=Glaciecola nitratireducens (strain JCM 12485 / KCTC 12276 / FR1064) TaxID=1085623 RepID=G4QM24_GLANF|nr:heme exporter protein CcmB [Glaciecola nitratireducens]AEP30595.1 heme exporter protein CcmB [Glaciecola nitratireducens FR1064]